MCKQYVCGAGVTTAQDGGVTDSMWASCFYAHAHKGLLCRVQLLPRYGSFTLSSLPGTAAGIPLTDDDMLSLGAIKLFQDGSLQAYTGFLTNPYHLNPLRSAIKRGMRFTLHNDTYVTTIDPLRFVWSAVNRLSSSGRVIGAEQRISVLDALRAVTIWGAFQFCEEK